MHEQLERAKQTARKARQTAQNMKEKIGINFLYLVGLIPILLLALYVRTRNLKWLYGRYLLGLDPYVFYRYAGQILSPSGLPAVDTLRYAPLGHLLTATEKFFSYTLAYGYKLVAWTGLSQMSFHIWYPVIAGIIGFIFMFLFVRELFDNKVALISTAFLTVIPTYIYRTGAGFADHEAMALMWMFIALFLFAKAWVASSRASGSAPASSSLESRHSDSGSWWEKQGRSIAFSASSGLFSGFMLLTWGGYRFLLAAVGLFMILMLLFSKLEDKHIYTYFVWIVVTAIFAYIRYGASFIRDYMFILSSFAVVACLVYLSLSKIKLSDDIERKFPLGFFSIIATTLIGLTVVLTTRIISLKAMYAYVFNPAGASRVSATVSENAQPWFTGGNGWMSGFGPTIWLILIGAVILFYFTFRGSAKYSGWLTFSWIVTLASLIFSHYKPSSSVNTLIGNSYLYVLAAFVLVFIGIYLHTYNKDKDNFEKIFNARWQLLFIFGWFAFTLVVVRGAIRTIMVMAPVAAIVVGFSVVKVFDWCWKDKHKVFAIMLGVFVLFCFVSNAQASINVSEGSGSGYPGQWEGAMNWIRESTSADAVFMHWWDYGYWTQTLGERASVVDGGNAMGWDHQAGRYSLLGRDPANYLPYLKTHGVTHLLISKEEMGKFHAFSTIGSDENWDLRSTIGTFALQQSNYKENRDGVNYTELIYNGGWGLDKDYVIGSKVLPQGGSAVIGFVLNLYGDAAAGDVAIVDPQVAFHDGTNQYAAPLKCICHGGACQTLNPAGFGGCLILLPHHSSSGEVNPLGAGFFVSEKVADTNLVKLYIKGEQIEYFTEVYSDGTPLGLYGGRVIGAVRIWEVNYPDWVETDEKYLESSVYG